MRGMQRRRQDRYDLCDLRKLSGRMRMARYASGLKWTQLAARTGYSIESVRAWEVGRRSIPASVLPILARAARCDVDWILTGQGTPPELHRRFLHITPDGMRWDPCSFRAATPVDD